VSCSYCGICLCQGLTSVHECRAGSILVL
jgi:hypothetical protein